MSTRRSDLPQTVEACHQLILELYETIDELRSALPSSSVSCTAQNANASSPTRARMRLSPQRLLNPLASIRRSHVTPICRSR